MMPGISRAAWSTEDREEYESLLRDVVASTRETSKRLDRYEQLINDAVQAHRPWARQVERANQRQGAAAEIKRFQDRTRALVSYDGRLLNLPAYQGVKTLTSDGDVIEERALIVICAWDQIAAKRATELRMRRSYDDRVALLDKLLALREMCPESTSPQDAAKRLGIVLAEYLGDVEAEAA